MGDRWLVFRITRMMRAIDSRSRLDELNPSARRLLNMIGEAETGGQPMRVGDALRHAGLGSTPTFYARLAELQSGGWAVTQPDPDDARGRRLHLTPQARKAFSQMSRELMQTILPGGESAP